MNTMKTLVAAVTLLAASISFAAQSPVNIAQPVIQRFFTEIHMKDMSALKKLLLPSFISLHTDMRTRNRAQELQLISKLNLHDTMLSHFRATRSGDTIVTTYFVRTHETIDNKLFSTHVEPRMTVLQYVHGAWHILAHANMNAPTKN